MGMVIAVRDDTDSGAFIGFLLDHEILECSECAEAAAYRIRYAPEEEANLPEHRFEVQRVIETEHPQHTDRIRIR